ncbi:MAG: 16S rRNA (guanine(527)-N(7))-methyltransferase RsmG [Peptococcaceae bacterium]|nr:16S rRNA (guanine(527)-N(7))-methyltransferase RsmG [Peptococcaceae bacterium]
MTEMRQWIETLLVPAFGLDAAQVDKFVRYYDLLIDWNSRMNLTAITEPRAVAEKHFYDSLLITQSIHFQPDERLIDIGSGAGFPGIPLAIACPRVQIDLLDSLGKRVRFLEAVAEDLGLDNVSAYHDRAELFCKGARRESYDWAIARAVAALPVLCEYALPFVREGGSFIASKGPRGMQELDEAARAMQALGGRYELHFHHDLPGGEARDYFLIKKIAPTPKRFPRKPGEAMRKPL